MKMCRKLIALLAVVLCMAGCRTQQNVLTNETKEPPAPPTTAAKIPSVQSVPFAAQYIRTNGGWSGYRYPNVVVIGDVQELETYYRNHCDLFDFETNGFAEACAGYDEPFFAQHYLLLVVLEEGSGSISHQVKKVSQTWEKELQVEIEAIVPEVGTADMAQWHIVLELPRDGQLPLQDQIFLYMYEKLVWNGSPVEDPVPPSLMTAPETPPAGLLISDEGQFPLELGGYSWTRQHDDGTESMIIVDYAMRMPEASEMLIMESQLCKLLFAVAPENVEITCYGFASDEVIPLQVEQNTAFAPLIGSYLYEIKATWQYGTACYYVGISRGLGLFVQYLMPLHLPESPAFDALVQQLDFRPEKICKCRAQYELTTADGRVYSVHLTEKYMRCEQGQADLSGEQIDLVKALIDACIAQTEGIS